MKQIIVEESQTLADITIQYCGDVTAMYNIAIANNLSVSDTLWAGQKLDLPDNIIDNDIVNYYKDNGITPATSINE